MTNIRYGAIHKCRHHQCWSGWVTDKAQISKIRSKFQLGQAMIGLRCDKIVLLTITRDDLFTISKSIHSHLRGKKLGSQLVREGVKKKITTNPKAALHKLPGKSSSNAIFVCPVCLLWLVCPVCPEMAANLFSRLERFCEESQVMAAHWSIALNDESWVSQSVAQSLNPICRYRAALAA